MKTLILIDDHEMMRRGLASWLAGTGEWQVLGEAASLEEGASLLQSLADGPPPDLALLDLELRGSWGLDLLPLLRERYGERTPPVLVYSMYDDYAHLKTALRCEVQGYICKSQSTAELRKAMDAVASGGTYFSPRLLSRMVAVSDFLPGLTRRERQIFEMVQRRLNNRQIASQLGLSLRTVANTLSIIYDKTGAKNRSELETM